MELSKMVKEYRDRLHMSQREFAKLVGVSNQTISNIERGYNSKGEPFNPDTATYKKLAQTMYLSLGDLLLQTGGEITINPETIDLSDEELRLIYCYRNADDDIKTAIKTLLARFDNTGEG